MKKLLRTLFVVGPVTVLVSVCVLKGFSFNKHTAVPVDASSSTAIITNLVDWEFSGSTLDNIDITSSSGSLKIDLSEFGVGFSCVTTGAGTLSDLTDNATVSGGITIDPDEYINCTVSSGSGDVFKIKAYTTQDVQGLQQGTVKYQDSSSSWHDVMSIGTPLGWFETTFIPFADVLAVEFKNTPIIGEPGGQITISEVALNLVDLNATHTSAATQITHNDLYQWQTFTPTYTAPANTTVSFRLRTSTDAATWTDWTAYQTPNSAEALDISSLVTSSTGAAGSETFYKYIQVETRLTSSDGVSTPTVDSYSIGYHTNVPPDKPTGGTATAGN
jgi:hypothetical protein